MTSNTLWAPLKRACSLIALVAVLAVPASATTYVVTSDSDDPSMTTDTPDGMVTLREALLAANADAPYGDAAAGTGDDVIIFADDVDTIVLQQGQLNITDGVTIDGDEDLSITTPGNRPMRLFNVVTSDDVLFVDLDLVGGFAAEGGAIFIGEDANVALNGASFERNRATDGGAVYVSSGATLDLRTGTSFSGNRANGSDSSNGGGAIFIESEATVTGNPFGSVSFTDNRSTVGSGSGGAIWVGGDLITNTPVGAQKSAGGGFVFDGNRAARAGGAIEVRDGGTVDLAFASFFNNFAGLNPGNGGAIHITGEGSATLFESIASDNVASAEGGAYWNSGSGTLTVNGGSFSNNIVRGNDADQGGGAIFSDGGDTMISGASFTGNRALGTSGSGGALFSNGADVFTVENSSFRSNTSVRAGGAIEVLGGTVTISGATMDENTTANNPGNGGGLHISSDGDVTITDSEVTGNFARNQGGGLWNSGVGSLTVITTTVSGNSTSGLGGGVYQQPGDDGLTIISNSEISGNSARSFGGGVFAGGAAMVIQNSTLSGNSATRGGGGASSGAAVSFESSTIAANSATGVGGGFSSPDRDNRVDLQNTLVADNSTAGDDDSNSGAQLSGFFNSLGNNLVESRNGAGITNQQMSDIYDVDAMIGPLADNGGPTQTHALLAGSPAIDAGMTDDETDQRGEPRMDPDDIGAFDFGDGMMAGDGAMLITGVFDGPLTGGTPKVIELYVTEAIQDLSLFGVGSANNGGGTDGEEFTFPMESAEEGEFIYVVDSGNADEFAAYFEDMDSRVFESGAAGINGDDAVELFMNDMVVDTFGDINVDGDNQPWEYADGWAYRMDGTGPDGMMFVVGNWDYSGVDANDGKTTNTDPNAFPIGSYDDGEDDGKNAQQLVSSKGGDAVTGLAPVAPNPIRSSGRVQFSIAQSEAVSVELYDMMGRRVQTLYTGTPVAESTVDVTIDAGSLASGVYVVVLSGQTVRETQRVTIAR